MAYGSGKSFIDWHNIFIEMLRLQGLTREVCLPNKGKVFTSSECNQFVICRWGNFLQYIGDQDLFAELWRYSV